MLTDRAWDDLPWPAQLQLLCDAEAAYGQAHEPRSGERQAAVDDVTYIAKRMKEIASDAEQATAEADPVAMTDININDVTVW